MSNKNKTCKYCGKKAVLDNGFCIFCNKYNAPEKNKKTIVHWTCSNCGKKLTHVDKDENITSDYIFIISRSNHSFYLEHEDDNTHYVTDNIENRNEKMSRFLCRECMDKLLAESEIIRKIFTIKFLGTRHYVY